MWNPLRRQHKTMHHNLVRAIQERDDAYEAVAALDAELHETQGFIAAVQGALSEVGVYEGMDVRQSTLQYVTELVRDHEELERRIDLAMLELRGEAVSIEEIAQILRGGATTPNDVRDLD